MNKLTITTGLFLFIFASQLFAQGTSDEKESSASFRITGTVLEKLSKEPMEYATVTLLNQNDSSIVNGNITDSKGKFIIGAENPGNYILQIKFIGYGSNYKNISLNDANQRVDLGNIFMGSASVNIGEVSVKANKKIDYQIDRKVVNVEEQYSSASGNAIDILANIPSIQVDIEDNVSIRGNSNFTVLIDGRPSILEGSEALQQIPAGMIKNIEIITNPSAKFDPEGTGGIINIITKKRTLSGLSGLVQGDIGLDDKYGLDFLLNYRTEKFNFFVGGDYRDRNYPGSIEREQETYNEDTISYLNSSGDYKRSYGGYNGRAGIEWFPDEKNTISLSGRLGYRKMQGISNLNYEEWTNFSASRNEYTNEEEWIRDGIFYGLNSDYTHNFNGKDRKNGANEHRLDINMMLFKREGDEESLNYLTNTSGIIASGQKSTETGPHQGIRYRINYQQPFTKAFNIEGGFQGRMHRAEETNELFDYMPGSGRFNFRDEFSHEVTYSRNIHAVYGLTKGEYNNWGYQLGLRSEYTYRDINMKDQGTFNIDRWDFFPTIHTSYQLGEKNQFMASYTRRIDRPRGWYLEPFITWSDAYNVRKGNPDLKPEYIDSYELAYQRELNDKHSFSTELYYRITDNQIERVRSVFRDSLIDSDNIMLRTYENVGTDYSLGTEMMLNTEVTDWWESDITGNFFDYRVKGEINGEELDRGSFRWTLRWNNIFNLTETTRLQINPEYDSREVEAQETESAVFELDGAIRQSFLNKKLNVTLQVRDILNTGKRESRTEAREFKSYRLYTHEAPIVLLNISWRINNYRNGREGRGDGDGGDSYGGEGDM